MNSKLVLVCVMSNNTLGTHTVASLFNFYLQNPHTFGKFDTFIMPKKAKNLLKTNVRIFFCADHITLVHKLENYQLPGALV